MYSENYMVEPCPWCGEYPEFSFFDATGTEWAECVNKDCPAMPSIDGGGTLADALVAWNSRTRKGAAPITPHTCPHCGCRAQIAERPEGGFAVECTNCKAAVPYTTILGAVELWNRRA